MTENRQLRDTFADPESRVTRTVVAIDMADSTAMKEQQPQATWLNSLGWMYDTVCGIALEAVPNGDIKYLGDGIMWVVDTDHTTAAVNAVIQIQEAIDKAGKGSGGAKGLIDFTCSAGISTGDVVGFTTPGGSPDYVGTVVDKAFRLCGAASPRAIFVDTPTLGAANMMRIRSSFGSAIGRTSDQYQGDVQRAPLKGIDQPVAYHEILWSQQLYGVKSATMTASADRLRSVPTSQVPRRADGPAPATSGPGVTERHRGEITFWRPDKEFGFARDPISGEDFHVSARLFVYRDDVRKMTVGREIAFVALGANDGDKQRRQAGAVLLVGEPADGPLVSLPAQKTYGWVRVEDAPGNRHLIFVAPEEVSGHKVGDILGFTVGASDHGACALQVEAVTDDDQPLAA